MRYIVLEGKTAGYVDFRLDDTVTPRGYEIEVQTTGRYAGYAITEREGELLQLVSGAYSVPRLDKQAMDHAGTPLGPMQFASSKMHPGTYRIQLLAHRPTRVKIPVEGLSRTIHLEVEERIVPQPDFLQDMGSGPGDVEARASFRRSPTTITLSSILQLVDSHQGSAIQQCLKQEMENQDDCHPSEDYGATFTVVSPGSTGPGWVYSFAGYYIGWGSGPHTAVQRVLQAALTSRNYSFVLNIRLSAPGIANHAKPAKDKTVTLPYEFAGVQDAGVCLIGAGGEVIGGCEIAFARPTDHWAEVEIVDSVAESVSATITTTGAKRFSICGKTEKPFRINPGATIYVEVHAHPTLECPMVFGTTGDVRISLSH